MDNVAGRPAPGPEVTEGRDPDVLLRRIEEMERRLAERTEEVGALRLELELLSTVDAATGLLKPNGLNDAIFIALQRAQRYREPFALISIKIPELSDIERAHRDGLHEALRHVAALLAAALRTIDRIGRLHSDTFAAVLPLAREPHIAAIVERLRTLLTAVPLTAEEFTYDLRPRFSAVVVDEYRDIEPAELLAITETALRRAEDGAPQIETI